MSDSQMVEIDVLRYRPEVDHEPVWQRYSVPFEQEMSVLGALTYIKDELDGTLSYRWSCRQAICGSCGMTVNGNPKLSCQTFVRDLLPGPIRIEPLTNLPIERDLVVSVEPFVKKLESVKPYIITDKPRALSEGEYLQTPQQLEQFAQYAGCINCMLCYAACPQIGLNPDFIGPGALALMHRYNADSRDQGYYERMEVIAAEEGVWSCTAVGYCSEVCPKHVDPANAVNQNKVANAKHYFLRFFAPRRSASESKS